MQTAWKLVVLFSLAAPATRVAAADPQQPDQSAQAAPGGEAARTSDQRQLFQSQQLITALPNTWVFRPGETPRIVWRDVETVRRLGVNAPLGIRWFDAQRNEAPAPNRPGRWLAWVEGTAPNGTPFRRGLNGNGEPLGDRIRHADRICHGLRHAAAAEHHWQRPNVPRIFVA